MQETKTSVIQAIVIICSIFTLVAGFLVSFVLYFSRRKTRFLREKKEMEILFAHELLKTQFETREEALNQIGEELHDHIGQLLSSTKMLLGITERSLPEVPDTLRTAEETLGQAIQDIRALSKSLNSEWLERFNLVENLDAEARRINAARTVNVRLFAPTHLLPVNANTQIILFRIIQESLHNAIKHAEARQIIIEVQLNHQLAITISDDGKGFDTHTGDHSGVGLINIRRRARLIGADINISSAKGAGTHITIKVPNQNSAK